MIMSSSPLGWNWEASLSCWTCFCVFSFLMCFCWKEEGLSFVNSHALWHNQVSKTMWHSSYKKVSLYGVVALILLEHSALSKAAADEHLMVDSPQPVKLKEQFGSPYCKRLHVVRWVAVHIPLSRYLSSGCGWGGLDIQNAYRPTLDIWRLGELNPNPVFQSSLAESCCRSLWCLRKSNLDHCGTVKSKEKACSVSLGEMKV